MLRAFSHHQLTTEHWMSLVQGFTLYELSTYNNAHPNAREACDLQLLKKRGAKACEFQTQRLNYLLFRSPEVIDRRIKADDQNKVRWAEAVMGCLADVASTYTHRLSCLIFLGALLDVEPMDILEENPKEGIPSDRLLYGGVDIDTLLILYAKVFPIKTLDVIDSQNKQGTLLHRLGNIYYAVDNKARDRIDNTIKSSLEDIANKALHPKNDYFVSICDTLMCIRHDLSPEKRQFFINALETVINKVDDIRVYRKGVRCAQRALVMLKAVDDPSILRRYISEVYRLNPLKSLPATWLVENVSHAQIPMILSDIKYALVRQADYTEFDKAIRHLTLLAYRLGQAELVAIAKLVIAIYDWEHEPLETESVLPSLLEYINDDGIVDLCSYVERNNIEQRQAVMGCIFMYASTTFLETIDADLRQEDAVWLRGIYVHRVLKMTNGLAAHGWQSLVDVFSSGHASDEEMAALAYNMPLLEPENQQKLINACLAKQVANVVSVTDVSKFAQPLIHSLSLMNAEQIRLLKKICQSVMDYYPMPHAMPRLDERGREFIKSIEWKNPRKGLMIRHAISCAEALDRAKLQVNPPVAHYVANRK